MARRVCRLCGQSSETFAYTLNDKLIMDFLVNAVVRLSNANSNTNVCNICYAKAKIVVSFVDLVNKTQNAFINKCQVKTESPQKMQHNYPDPSNFVAVKQEFPDEHNLIIETRLGENSNFSDNLSNSEEPPKKKIVHEKPTSRPKNSLPQKNSFKCGNCKKEHESFPILESHISQCYKSTREFKCFVCLKQFDTCKKLQSHMTGVHKKDRAPRRPKKIDINEPRSIKFKCNKCTSNCSTFLELAGHKRNEHPQESSKSNDSNIDMNGMILESIQQFSKES